MFHARIVCAEWSANQFVTIQVDESDLFVSKILLITTLRKHQLCVSLMSWSLGYQHGFRAQPAERFGRCEDEQWVGIDCVARNVIHQIGLEDHGLACHVDREEAKTYGKELVEFLGVLLCMEDRNSRSLWSLIGMMFGQKERSSDRRTCRHSGAAN